MYLHNFNPEKSKNPFAYFTQIIYYAFLRRIQKEKRQTELKQRLVQNMMVDETMFTQDGDDSAYSNQYLDFLQDNYVRKDSNERELEFADEEKTTKKERKGALDEFMEE